MKLKLAILSVAMFGASAFSQPLPSPVASETAAEPVNPFTGKTLSGEQLLARLEASRLLTASLEEQLKQVTLTGEIQTVPLRKAAEAATVLSATRTEELKLAAVEEDVRAKKAEVVQRRAEERAAAKAAKAAAKAAAERAKNPPVERPVPVAAPPRPTLLSVMTSGGATSALLDFNGATVVVADGGMTPLGPVRIVDEQSVMVAGQLFVVSSSSLSRFASAPATPSKNASGTQAALVAPTSAQLPNGAPPLPALSVEPGRAGTPAKLPPLQLPPGLQVFPGAQ